MRHLFDACKEEIEAGNRPMRIFTATSLYGVQELCYWSWMGCRKETVDCPQEWWDEHLAVSTVPSLYIFFSLLFVVVCLANFIYLVSEMQ